MRSLDLVDPQLAVPLGQVPRVALTRENLGACRTMMDAMVPPPVLAADLTVHEAYAPGGDGAPDVRLVVTAPRNGGSGRPGLLHVHGGGFVLSSAELTRETDAAYSRELGAVCVSVDFRRPPETPHPGPVEDCYAGLTWLYRNAAALGVDTTRIAVTGESGGGGIAAGLVLLARDRQEVPVAFQHLIYPMLDDRTASRDDRSPCFADILWSRENNRFGWACLIGGEPGGADVSPYASPARAESLAGLPPTFIACGALDLFVEENIDYAYRLIRAGVPTEFHVYPGAPHGFDFVRDADVTQAFLRDSMAALKQALATA